MGNYFRTPEMQSGKNFRCYNCGKHLAVKIKGTCEVHFHCPRCKSYITVKMKEPAPWVDKKQEAKNELANLSTSKVATS